MSENFNSLPKYEIISDEIGSFDFIYKIILIGDSSVGKSCITYRATKDSFINNYTPTNLGYLWARKISIINIKFLS